MTEADREEVKEIVASTFEELLRQNNIMQVPIKEAGEQLSYYYTNGCKDSTIKKVLKSLEYDGYINIIPLYYGECKTIEAIAEIYDVDISTIVRNKKRLLKKISLRII